MILQKTHFLMLAAVLLGLANTFDTVSSFQPTPMLFAPKSFATDTMSGSRKHSVSFKATTLQALINVERTEQEVPIQESIPNDLSDAIHIFFLGQYNGPRVVVLILLGLFAWRCALPDVITVRDGLVSGMAVVFWWFQEHVIHKHLLHSEKNWQGKEIHCKHHEKPYYHISIDPAGLMMGWLFAVQGILMCLCPLSVALSATIGYAGAGLFYEWAHFIVHTKVRFRKGTYWSRMKDHHIRHHLVDEHNWFGFSLPTVDTIFGTNPTVAQARLRKQAVAQE